MNEWADKTLSLTREFFVTPNPLRSLLIFVVALIVAVLISKLFGVLAVRAARLIINRSAANETPEHKLKLRRTETFMGVFIAAGRVVVIIIVAYLIWSAFSPISSPNVAAIGASAIFVVLAGGTIGPLLRDITAGSAMIAERWFNVGDYIRVEPFMDVNGVVERLTLRSTKFEA